MLLWWTAVALAAAPKATPKPVPPPPPVEQACALDHLPDGRVRWSQAGLVQILLGDGNVLSEIQVGSTLPPGTQVRCAGALVRIFSQTAGATLSFIDVKLDLTDTLATLIPDPLEAAASAARAALREGHPDAAEELIRPFPAADPRIAPLWHQLAAASLADAGTATGDEGLRRLQPALDALAAPAWDPTDVAKIRELEARLRAEAGLARADAYWQAGDHDRAREEYAAVAAVLPSDRWPPELADRCRKCR